MLSLLANAGTAQDGMQRAAVDGHILRHLGVRMGELHEFHSCRNLRTQLVSRAPKIEFILVRLSKLKAVTHSLIIIGRCRQQDEGEDPGKATNGVQLAVGKRGAQLLPGTFLCKRKNLERASQSSFHREEPEFGGESLCRGALIYLTGRGGPAVLPVGEEGAMAGLGIGVVVRSGRGQELDIVRQHSGPSVRLGDIQEVTRDECLGGPQGAQDVQGVVTRLQA